MNVWVCCQWFNVAFCICIKYNEWNSISCCCEKQQQQQKLEDDCMILYGIGPIFLCWFCFARWFWTFALITILCLSRNICIWSTFMSLLHRNPKCRRHTNNPPEKSTKTKAHKQMNSIQRKTTAYAYLFCRYSMRNKNSTNWTCFRLNNIVLKINFFATRSSLLLDGWRGQSKRQTVCDAMNKNTQTHNQTK